MTQKPLPEENIRSIWDTACTEWVGTGSNPYLQFARAIEKAHGIGVAPQTEGLCHHCKPDGQCTRRMALCNVHPGDFGIAAREGVE